jgi:Ras-related protein Rab-8A
MKLQIWDTAGQEKFRTITYTYYKGAQGVILAYDCSDLNSFKNIGAWMEQISEHASEDVAKILICTKCDVDPSKRVVTKQMGEEIAEQFGLKHFETSAKLDYGVKQAFDYIANEVRLNTDKSKTNTDNKRVRVGQSSSQNSKQSCC